ncbi:BSD domain-containing protein 1-like [Acanthaster planci]|uniref:BSD domain-containing protein 1-like n=1 Tax=Acanthaster planci TaxID=133434 RepID=A0A8B7YWK1_ACAPL|nr:BSD domain-containing protein 1-like [Acanthaster planci]
MATGTGGKDEGSWWGGWIEAAKQKSAVALEQMKKDLNEFGSTIQRDTSTAVASSAGVIRESLNTEPDESSTSSRVKKGFSDWLSGLSESLAPKNPGIDEETHQPASSKTSHHIFDRAKARLHSMQIDAGTYCTDPEGPPHVYEEWLQSFDIDRYKGDISELLVANTDVRAIYTKLVPAVVSNADFWGRYFYKVHQLEQDEARRTALKERAEMTSSQTFDEEELQWDDDEEDLSAALNAHECRSSPVKQPHTDDRVAGQPTNRALAELREHPQSSHGGEDEEAVITATATQADLPCQQQQPPTQELYTKPADQDDQTTSRTSLFEQISGVGDPSQEHDSVVLDSSEENDSKDAPTQREDAENMELSDECGEDEDLIESKESNEAQDTKGRSADGDALVIQVSSEETPIEKKTSPSGSDASNKDSSLSDDWEKDFDDIDVTDEDLAAAAYKTKTQPSDANDDDDDDLDDWESWE